MRPYWLPLLLLSSFIPAQAYTLQGPQYAEDPVKVAQRERAEQAKQQELKRQQEQAQGSHQRRLRVALSLWGQSVCGFFRLPQLRPAHEYFIVE